MTTPLRLRLHSVHTLDVRENMNMDTLPKNQVLVYWILWAAILWGMMFLQFFHGGGIPAGEDAPNPPQGIFIFCISIIAISTIIRWILIPKAKDRGKLLVLMIIGLALIDGAQIFQLFLIGPDYPQKQITILVLALIGAVQFVPTYAKKINSNKSAHTTSAIAPR